MLKVYLKIQVQKVNESLQYKERKSLFDKKRKSIKIVKTAESKGQYLIFFIFKIQIQKARND